MGAHVDNRRNVWQLHQNQAAFQNALVLPTDPAGRGGSDPQVSCTVAAVLHPASNPLFKFRSQRPKPRLKKNRRWRHRETRRRREWLGVRGIARAARTECTPRDAGREADEWWWQGQAGRDKIHDPRRRWYMIAPFPTWIFVRFPFPPAPCLYLLGYCQIPALVIWRARPLPRAAVSSSLLCPAAAPGAAAEIKGCGVTGFCES